MCFRLSITNVKEKYVRLFSGRNRRHNMMAQMNINIDDINHVSIEKHVKIKLTNQNSSDDDARYINTIWKEMTLSGSDAHLMKEMITTVSAKKEVKVEVKVER